MCPGVSIRKNEKKEGRKGEGREGKREKRKKDVKKKRRKEEITPILDGAEARFRGISSLP